MKKLALILTAIFFLIFPVSALAQTATVSVSPQITATQTAAVSVTPKNTVTNTAKPTPTGTPWVAYTEPPYTPVTPSTNMIVIYFVIAVFIAAGGTVIYFVLKKAEHNADIK